jgi:hypothetical protein
MADARLNDREAGVKGMFGGCRLPGITPREWMKRIASAIPRIVTATPVSSMNFGGDAECRASSAWFSYPFAAYFVMTCAGTFLWKVNNQQSSGRRDRQLNQHLNISREDGGQVPDTGIRAHKFPSKQVARLLILDKRDRAEGFLAKIPLPNPNDLTQAEIGGSLAESELGSRCGLSDSPRLLLYHTASATG